MVKAIFFDVDGTLLSHQTHSVPASTVRALKALREKGVLTFLATGRHIPMLRELMSVDELCFEGIVSLNGQYCCNSEGIIYHCPFPKADLAVLLDYLKEHPHPCILIEEEQMYINFHNELVEKVQAGIRAKMPIIGDLNRGYTEPIYQALLYISDEDFARLPPMPGIRFSRWILETPDLSGADLYPASGGKAIGIAKVLEHYGIDKKDTMAFGDGQNDVDMFGAVGTAIAMANGCDEAKNAADYITDEVDADGIWNALKHFGVL